MSSQAFADVFNMDSPFNNTNTISLRLWCGLLLIDVAVSLGLYAFCRSYIFNYPSKEIFGTFLATAFIFSALWAIKGLGIDLNSAFKHYNGIINRSLRSAIKYLGFMLALGVLMSLIIIAADVLATKLDLLPQDSFSNILLPGPSRQNSYISSNLIHSPLRLFLFIIASCLLAPIGEEFVFRRLLYVTLRKKHTIRASLLVSSIIFGVFHGGNWFIAFGKGLVFGYGYEETRDIQAIIFLHMLVNALALGIGFSLALV